MPNTYGGFAYATGEYAGPNAGNSPGSELNGGLFPVLIIEIGFGFAALAEPVTWTDVTNWVSSFSIRRGRQHELGRFEAGTATIALSNRDGRFSPFNTSSPYNPNVVPKVPVRIRAIYNGLTWPVFRGHIESWPVKWPSANDSDVTVAAVDATKALNAKRAQEMNTAYPAAVQALAPYLYWRLNDPPGSTTAADSSGNARTGTVFQQTPVVAQGSRPFQFGVAGAIAASTASGMDCGSQAGEVYYAPASINISTMTAEAWVKASTPALGTIFAFINGAGDRALSLTLNSDGTLNFFSTSPGAPTNQIFFTGVRSIVDGQWHHVVAAMSPTIAAIYIDGLQDKSSGITSGAGPMALTGQTFFEVGGAGGAGVPVPNATQFQVQEVAIYLATVVQGNLDHFGLGARPREAEISGARITALLNAIGWPAGLAAIDAGNSPLQAATNSLITQSVLANMQMISDTEAGQLFVDAAGRITFYNRNHTQTVPLSSVAIILGDSGTALEEPYLLDSIDLQYDDLDVYNEVAVTPNGQGTQIASDSGSQTTNGKITLPVPTINYSLTEAASRATANLTRYKAPLQRVRSVSFTPMSDPNVLFPAALGFELLTRVELRRRPMDGAGSTFDQIALIEGIQHTVNAQDGSWKTTWSLSPTDALAISF